MANGMRVQLQQQRGGRTIHHGSEVLTAESGVTTEEVIVALHLLRDSGQIPGRQAAGADAALAKAITWVAARPPAGVSGRFSKGFYFDPESSAASWRFDIEGLQGTHLLS